MKVTTNTQPTAASSSSPLAEAAGVATVNPPLEGAMTVIVNILAGMQQRYRKELTAAREKAKKNFL